MTAAPTLYEFRLTFECDGAQFVWSGVAPSWAIAEQYARDELSQAHAAFSSRGARLVGVVVN